jgi:hypothetical protein
MRNAALAALVLLFAGRLAAQSVAVVEDAPWGPLRDHCRQLVRALETSSARPLPTPTIRALRAALEKEWADPDAAVREVQRLLDPHCLLSVEVNPESRVKAFRGPAPAALCRGEAAVALVKFHNAAGVTHAPAVRGPGLVGAGGGWLEAEFVAPPPLAADLGGGRLEYRLLRLRAREVGKREATLRIDVGQGTQDLGFRAEVPVLFTVRDR